MNFGLPTYKHNVKYKISNILIHLILRTAYLNAVSNYFCCSFRICRNVILYSFFRINECIQFSLPQFLGRWLISNCLPFGKLPSQLQFFATMRIDVKNFMDPLEVVKKHWVAKIGVFRPLFCLRMLGKSTSYSTGTQPLSSCFWAK